METVYLMAGKRFQAPNVHDLNEKLFVHNLVTNLRPDGTGSMTVRRSYGRDAPGTPRYDIVQSHGDAADIQGFDVCIGKRVGRIERGVVRAELSDIAAALTEVKQDIPDAGLYVGSHWS